MKKIHKYNWDCLSKRGTQEMAIRADRKNHFMSVEFAMQREMNYRKKLELKVSAQSHLPEVPRPTSSQDTRGTPRATVNLNMNSAYLPQNHGSVPPARPSPYPYPPHIRPSPSSCPSRSADQHRNGPVPLPEGIFTCKVCQLDCKTGFNLLSHYQGQKHKAKMRGEKGKEVAVGSSTPRENEKRPYCDVCRIWCADEYTFRLHFSCTNHILKQYDWLMKKRMVL